MLFASGGLAYFAGRAVRKRVPPEGFTTSGGIALAILAAVVCSESLVGGQEFSRTIFTPSISVMPPFPLVVALASPPHLFYAFRDVRFDSFLGELSYPMYLSHVLVGGVLLRLHLPAWLTYGNLLYVVATLVASTLLVAFIVIPVDRWRTRFGARIPTISTAGCEPSESARGLAVPQNLL